MRTFTIALLLVLFGCTHQPDGSAKAPDAATVTAATKAQASPAKAAPRPQVETTREAGRNNRWQLGIPKVAGWAQVPRAIRGADPDSTTDVFMNPALGAVVYIDTDQEPAMAPLIAATAYQAAQKEQNPNATYSPPTEGFNGQAAAFTVEQGEEAGMAVVRRAVVRPNANLVFQGTWPKASASLALRDFMAFSAFTELNLWRVTLLEPTESPWIPIPADVAGVPPTAHALAHAKFGEKAQLTVELIHPMAGTFDEYAQMMRERMPALTQGPVVASADGSSVSYEVRKPDEGYVGLVTLRRIEGASDSPSLAVIFGSWAEEIEEDVQPHYETYVRALTIREEKAETLSLRQAQPPPAQPHP